MATGDFDWPQVVIEGTLSLISAFGGLVIGAWKWGRNSVLHEQRLRDEFNDKMEAFSKEVRTAMANQQQAQEDRLDGLVDQFKETFVGLRRTIDQTALDNEKRFFPKDDFRAFREEYREDMRDLKKQVGAINGRS
jgi:preprotein translocase subunit SecA